MIRSTSLFLSLAALASATAAPVLAGEAPARASARSTSQPAAQIVVAVCERDALTQAAFRQNYGPHPVYVTADEVLSARAAGERWSAPRCMNARQHSRLADLMAPRASR